MGSQGFSLTSAFWGLTLVLGFIHSQLQAVYTTTDPHAAGKVATPEKIWLWSDNLTHSAYSTCFKRDGILDWRVRAVVTFLYIDADVVTIELVAHASKAAPWPEASCPCLTPHVLCLMALQFVPLAMQSL